MKNLCENCGECCIGTEMILSPHDIDLIIKYYPNKITKKQFVLKNEDGNYQIKNVENHCVFLDLSTKKCKIYKNRPQGCRYYPLIYDFQKGKCTFDKDCPRTHLFYQNRRILNETCKNLKDFIKDQLKFVLD